MISVDTRGRPETDFHLSSERTKRRKTESIRASYSAAKLSYATVMRLRDEGDEATSKLLKAIATTTPTRARRVLSKWRKTENVQTQLSGEEAVSLIISSEFTKRQYKILRVSVCIRRYVRSRFESPSTASRIVGLFRQFQYQAVKLIPP